MAKRYDPIMCMLVDEPTKAQDVAPATQRYINTIVDESKANAEKFVRQAEQDDEVPENELKYVYKAYNEKFGYKFHDSASALDKAISTCDAVDDIYVRRSNEYYVNVKLGKSNPQISATISRILNKDKRVDGVLGSPGNWDVAIEGKDNAEYIKKILSGVGNIK